MLGKYTIRLRKRGAYEPSFCYLIDSLLQSRIATRNESNKEYYDEDTNVYIAHLLNSIVNERFQEMAARYVVGCPRAGSPAAPRTGRPWARALPSAGRAGPADRAATSPCFAEPMHPDAGLCGHRCAGRGSATRCRS